MPAVRGRTCVHSDMSKRSLMKGMGAGAYAQLLTLVLQLLSVPIFLRVWTLEDYGYWLIAGTAQAYLALSDFGVVAVAGSRMTVLVARGAPRGAQQVFASAVLFISLVCLGIVVLSPAVGLAFAAVGLPSEYAAAASVLVVGIAVSQFGGLSFSLLRATSRNHVGIVISSTTRAVEWGGGMVGLLVTGNPIFVAAGMLVGRTIATLVSTAIALRGQDTFAFSWGSWRILRLYAGRSTSQVTGTLAASISLQGMTLVVGGLYGASAVAIFGTYRTAARTIVQSTAIVSNAAWPQFGIHYGTRNMGALHRFFRRTQGLSAISSSLAVIAFLALLPLLLELWTHGEVPVDYSLAVAFAVYAFAASLWHVPRVFLNAIGRNRGVALTAVATALLVVGVAILVGRLGLNITAQAWTMAFGEAVMAVATLIMVNRWFRSPEARAREIGR